MSTKLGMLRILISIAPIYVCADNVPEELCFVSNKVNVKGRKEFSDKFESHVDQLTNELLEQSIKKIGKPIFHMRKGDKLQIIRDLKENGFFLLKGSAKRVSHELNVSLATIYQYLEEIQEI